jgi:hypothetical protein
LYGLSMGRAKLIAATKLGGCGMAADSPQR